MSFNEVLINELHVVMSYDVYYIIILLFRNNVIIICYHIYYHIYYYLLEVNACFNFDNGCQLPAAS